MRQVHLAFVCVALFMVAQIPVVGQVFEMAWYTVDGGGLTPMGGGGFTLNATTAQPDAGVLRAGEWELTGGFWAMALRECRSPADMNGDGERNSLDIQGFVDCVIHAEGDCICAQLDGAPGLDLEDLAIFVEGLVVEPAALVEAE
ncbi:MAG: hypothetical protein DCC65_13405 [Planctomycetota bacterium]|nr:MAG: hypothetical protein DCC65_13405 [Planctomycetota bacterium]